MIYTPEGKEDYVKGLASNIGDLQCDEQGRPFRMINGRKIYQIEEKTEQDRKTNESINMVRASGMRVADFLKEMYG